MDLQKTNLAVFLFAVQLRIQRTELHLLSVLLLDAQIFSMLHKLPFSSIASFGTAPCSLEFIAYR